MTANITHHADKHHGELLNSEHSSRPSAVISCVASDLLTALYFCAETGGTADLQGAANTWKGSDRPSCSSG